MRPEQFNPNNLFILIVKPKRFVLEFTRSDLVDIYSQSEFGPRNVQKIPSTCRFFNLNYDEAHIFNSPVRVSRDASIDLNISAKTLVQFALVLARKNGGKGTLPDILMPYFDRLHPSRNAVIRFVEHAAPALFSQIPVEDMPLGSVARHSVAAYRRLHPDFWKRPSE